ncbi:MAG TPA: BamA/TamA family outer membrane protein [Flavobacteriales bacterium]|nr:BamA/TamA family outer membrane protein [Flavobacteriales bacterium]
MTARGAERLWRALLSRGRLLLALLLLHAGILAAQDTTNAFPGPFRVSGILVDGNRITKERVVLRELTFREGDTLDAAALYQQLARSRDNLMNLGLFNTAQLLPNYVGPQEVFIIITLNERWYWWPQPMVRLADPNFNTWWLTKDLGRINFGLEFFAFNMRGRNETLVAKAQLGYSREFGLAYRVPFVDKRQRWGVQVNGGYAEQDEITLGTEDNKRILLKTPAQNIIRQWRTGATLTLRRTHDIRHGWSFSWNDVAVRDTVVLRNPDYLAPFARRMGYLAMGYTMVLDRRDSRAFPLSGSYGRLALERYGVGPQQPDVTALKATVQHSWKRGDRWSLGASLSGKTSQGTGNHYYLQEGLGYGDHLRGYEYYVIDGQHWFLGKANVLFTLVRPRLYRVEAMPLEAFRTFYIAVYLNAFSDQGYVADQVHAAINPLANHWQHSYGMGLDFVTSYDQVLRVEAAVNVLQETGFYLHFTQPF